ncbi:DUF1648 domain-containing protein [Streptomyces sp. NPDC126503]|uniref:DUF1648 domain-containing protein n=1 Tax=Streptomyces sp. NPDC126503 TaxID=3155315 RepID=UPI00332FCDDD
MTRDTTEPTGPARTGVRLRGGRPWAALPFLLALTGYAVVLVLWWDRLPDPVATHFSGADGHADGWTSRTGTAVTGAVLLVVAGAVWTAFVRRPALAGAWATAGFLGALLALMLRANLDATGPEPATLSLGHLAAGAAVAGLAALAGWAVSRLVVEEGRPGASAPEGEPDARLPLGAGEVAGWSRYTGSAALTALGAGLVLAGPVVLAAGWWPVAPLLVAVGAAGLGLARVRVTADRRGLTVAPAVTGRPRIRIPLDEIEGADARDVRAVADFGGWGYRVRAHRTGLVLRSGEALVVRRAGGREFAVTVPDARTAAALLNTLAARHGKV